VYSVSAEDFVVFGGDGFTMIVPDSITLSSFGKTPLACYLKSLANSSVITTVVDGRITTTDEVLVFTTPTDEFYVNWGHPAAIVFMIIAVLLALFVLAVGIFVVAHVMTAPVWDTSITFHVTNFFVLFFACFTIFFFIGQPTDSWCAVRPWTSLVFTAIFGNLLAKQVSTLIQWLISFKKKESSVLHVKYNPGFWLAVISPLLIINFIYVIIWTAVDHPYPQVVNCIAGSYDTELTCRSSNDTVWVVLLFTFYGLIMIATIVISLVLIPATIMWNEARYIGLTVYATSAVSVVTIILVNALRDIPLAWFVLLEIGILAGVLCVVLVLYTPLVVIIIYRHITRRKRKVAIETDVVDKDNEKPDELDDL